MADFSQIPNFHIKVVFLIHLMLTSLGLMGSWSSTSYLFYNTFLIVSLLWGIHKSNSEEPVQLAVAIDGLAIVLDILVLAMCYPDSSDYARERFSAAIAILHLLARPFLLAVLLNVLQVRMGGTGNVVSNLFGGARSESYEDIDGNLPTQSNPTQASYDFNTTQQI